MSFHIQFQLLVEGVQICLKSQHKRHHTFDRTVPYIINSMLLLFPNYHIGLLTFAKCHNPLLIEPDAWWSQTCYLSSQAVFSPWTLYYKISNMQLGVSGWLFRACSTVFMSAIIAPHSSRTCQHCLWIQVPELMSWTAPRFRLQAPRWPRRHLASGASCCTGRCLGGLTLPPSRVCGVPLVLGWMGLRMVGPALASLCWAWFLVTAVLSAVRGDSGDKGRRCLLVLCAGRASWTRKRFVLPNNMLSQMWGVSSSSKSVSLPTGW